MHNDHIQFLDPSPLYNGHRFCEPGHTLNNQYFLNDVWFWNLSPPEDDPDYLIILTLLPLLPVYQAALMAEVTYPNGTKATECQVRAMVSGSNLYSSGRTFQPKTEVTPPSKMA